LKDYYEILKDGGILAGHEFNNHQDVTNAVIDFCNKKGIKPLCRGEDWIISKGFFLKDEGDYTQNEI
jgi:hypothetical protein